MPHNAKSVYSIKQAYLKPKWDSIFWIQFQLDIQDSVSTIRNNSRIVNYSENPITSASAAFAGDLKHYLAFHLRMDRILSTYGP